MSLNNLTYSAKGLALTEQFEGCRLTAYQDQSGIWTIGYGHTGPDIVAGLTISQEQAQALLAQDLRSAEACVNNSVTVSLTQDEFDALVDFAYNVGNGAFKGSRMLHVLNSGDYAGAAAQFQRWDHVGDDVSAGLLRRRQAEVGLFNNKDSATQSG
jgi:lysozyme